MPLSRPSIMKWSDIVVTDHNRSPLQESVELIERKARMANGTLRKYVVAKKKTWSCSWDMLPAVNTVAGGMNTVDGGMAGQEMLDFYNATNGSFTMRLYYGDGTQTLYTVMFNDFTREITKRGMVDLWSVSTSLEEV